MHRLPARIAAVMIGTILVFLLTIGASMLWMSRALDQQARDNSLSQVRVAMDNVLGRIRAITLDYAKWEEAVAGVASGDLDWLYSNIGVSANIGQAMQVAVIWGGPFPQDFGWTDDGATLPDGRPGLLDPGLLPLADERLSEVEIGSYDGIEFFASQEGQLYALAAARIERGFHTSGTLPPEEELARLVIGLRMDGDQIAAIAESTLLTGLAVLPEQPAGNDFLPLLGVEGQPVAFLAWDSPQPGTAMLRRMAPLLVVVMALAAGLTLLGMAQMRRGAQNLVTAKQEATVAALTDALTGLPNRAAFKGALAAPARAGERAILFLDLNDFKRINDSIGHAAGDQVIVEMARRLVRLGGEGRLLARIGGDEFVLLLTGPEAGAQTEELAREVERAMEEPFEVLGHQLQIMAAVGHAVQAADAMAGDDLLRQADLAMYEAKRHKDRGAVAFGALIEQAVQDARTIETGLRAALEQGEGFSIAYQPIAGPGGGLALMEALARWTSPELGVVPPDRFIAVAERSGLIIRLGRVLLRLICGDLAAHPDLRVSINISPLQLMAPSFVQDLLAELAERGIDPFRIEIELTEAVVVDDPTLAAERLRELHAAGFSTALDDFGAGYSSIGYLRQMGFDTLKVDRSFVSGFCEAPERLELVNAMILLAHALGLRVTCEGVETEEELQMLRELGCDLAQGYHLGRPLPIDVMAARWLTGGQAAAAVA